MLIYVDKKKEKQKKIRKLLLILFILFFIIINLWQFNLSLNHAKQSLTDYQLIKHLNSWYNNADIVYLFTGNKNKTAAIIIPKTFNQENATTIALALSKISQQKYNIILASNMSKNDSLMNLIKVFLPQAEFNSSANAPDIIIANNIENAVPHIIKNKLFPHALNYKHTKKIQELPALKNFIKNTFPPMPLPKNTLEQESKNLQSFITTHKQVLKDFIFLNKEPPFTNQNLFLQNIRLCLKTKENNLSCALDTTVSLRQNITKAKAGLGKENSINKVYFLTSDMKTTPQPDIRFDEDEGLRFVYQNRNALLLPEDIKLLDNPLEAFYILKEKTGINPLFNTPDMYFYKIKLKEITYDENI